MLNKLKFILTPKSERGSSNIVSLDRVEIFDVFRAISSLGIVFVHYFWCDTFKKILKSHYFEIDGVFMGAFFFTTGFLICLSLERCNTKQFIIKRIFRLMPVYLLALVSCCLILHKFKLKDFFVNLFLIKDIVDFSNQTIVGPAWSMMVELKFYILSAICFFIFKRTRYRLYSMIMINTAVFYLLIYFKIPVHNFTMVNIVLLGSVVYFYMQKDISKIEFFILYLLCVLVFDKNYSYSFSNKIAYNISFIILPIIVLNFSSFGNYKVIKYLANLSYSLYLFHIIFGGYGGFIGGKYYVYGKELYNVCLKLFFFSVCICCCHFIYYKIEKPCYDFGRRLAKRFESKK